MRVPKRSAVEFLPERHSLNAARDAAARCRGCSLWQAATQTVFGEGPRDARVMLVGEVPGDQEDRSGRPFVGPAGRLLDRALEAARIERSETYVTNAVKHFKWEPRGKRRLHRRPSPAEIDACRPWLGMEIELVHPLVIVCLGATASQALLGRGFRVTEERGKFIPSTLARYVIATIHPSALLRLPDEMSRAAEMQHFITDLELVRGVLESEHAS
jgi:uracil-DNA glycosylase